MIKRNIIGVIFLFYAVCTVLSQNEVVIPINKSVNQSTVFGVGSMSLTDTYLTPLEYNGVSFSILHERLNSSSLLKSNLIFQQLFFLQASTTENPIGNSNSYYVNIDYQLNSLYPFLKAKSFRLLGGVGADFSLGGIYNIRNGNNPAQLKASANLNASLSAFYTWRLFTVRWQVTSPFLGVFFSPEYGHSYYEIFVLGNNSGTIHVGTPSNQLGFSNYITVDYPIGKVTVRGGYLSNYYRTNTNNLTTSISSHQFLIGLAFESLNFGGREVKENNWIKSVYYDYE